MRVDTMSALTKNERDGLEDVFMSIHTNQDRYQKFKDLATLLLSKESKYQIKKFIKVAKYGLKEARISQYFTKTSKKKKNLSK